MRTGRGARPLLLLLHCCRRAARCGGATGGFFLRVCRSTGLGLIIHITDQISQVLYVEPDPLRLCFRWGCRLPGGLQSSGRVRQRFVGVRRPDRQLFRESHLTLDIFSLVCLQPLHRTLFWSACRCPDLPGEVRPQWAFWSQAWRRGS